MSVSVPLSPPFKVKARYGWSGQTKGDLGFLEGDVMEVTRITGDWFYGRLLRNKKCSGYFPNNFVNVLEEQLNKSTLDKSSAIPSLPEKVVIPPIPARSRGKSSTSSSQSESQLSYGKRGSRVYEQQSHSAPNLPQDAFSTRKSHRGKSRSSMDRPGSLRDYYPTNDSLPPLPPIPALHKAQKAVQRFPKSYSSSDLPSSATSRDCYPYRDNQEFYDGYHPSKRSSLTGESSSSGLFSNSQYWGTSAASSEDSFALMSDFSATSAGSFARHRFAQSFTDSLERSQSQSLNDTVQSSGVKRGGIFRRIMTKNPNGNSEPLSPTPTGQYPKLPDIKNLNISATRDDARDWLAVKTHLNRSRSLTKYEKHPRYMRALDENRELVLHPQDAIYNGLNTNEVTCHGQPGLIDIELSELNFDYIDKMTRKRCVKDGSMRLVNWAQTTFSARYSTTVEKLRGVFVFCTETFELIDDHGSTDFSKTPKDLDKILYQKYCTPYQLVCLFKALTNTLGITCEIVFGFLKTPAANNFEFKYNHCWLRVLVNKEWRFIDVILGSISNPVHEFVNNKKITKANDDYFLVEPLRFIYTHIPQKDVEQHIVPSIDRLSALYLPLVFPSFFNNGLKLYKYSTALAFLEDSEIFECSLEISNDIEVFASVVIPATEPSRSHEYRKMELALVQVKRHKSDSSRRIAVIKAVLPPGSRKGTLYVHSGLRGTQTTVANVHPLSMMVPLTHNGSEMKYEFTVRKPSESAQKTEMYIMEPQNRFLFLHNEYDFEVIQHPFDSVVYGPTSLTKNRPQPMAIKSPSGKIYELQKIDPHFAFGTWKATICVKEAGVWTGLVTTDSGVGWCAFTEWLCI